MSCVRFGCEQLILVGDPRQLAPTIQGSQPAHQHGLEQTLFERLAAMVGDTTSGMGISGMGTLGMGMGTSGMGMGTSGVGTSSVVEWE